MCKLLLSVIVLIFLTSCETKYKNWNQHVKSIDDMFRVFDNEIKLNAETFINDSVNLLNPFEIKIIGKYMIIQELGNSSEGIVSLFDMANKRFLGRMFHHGNGPNEFLGLRINPYSKDTMLVLDPYKKIARLYGVNNIKINQPTPDHSILFQSPDKGEQIDQCYWFNNKLICSGQFQKGRFQIYDTNGKYLKSFDEFHKVDAGKNQLDNIQLGSILGAFVSFGNNSQMSKLACIGTNSLAVYDYNRDKNEFSKTFFAEWFLPKIQFATYRDGKPFVGRNPKVSMVGAGNIAGNDKYLFFPFSSYTISDIMNKGIENRYGFIFVVNWDGKPIAKIILNKSIHFPLQIDKEGKYLYAVHTDQKTGFSQIVRYDISFLK